MAQSNEVLKQIVNNCKAATNSDRASLFLIEQGETGPEIVANKFAHGLKKEIRLSLKGSGIAPFVARTGKLIVTPDPNIWPIGEDNQPLYHQSTEKITKYKVRNMIAVPVIWRDPDSDKEKTLGVIQVLNHKRFPAYTGLEVTTLLGLAEHTANCIYDSQQNKRPGEMPKQLEEMVQLSQNMGKLAELSEKLFKEPEPEEDFETSTLYLPSEQVGGDCYLFTNLPDRKKSLFLADIAGHGFVPFSLATNLIGDINATIREQTKHSSEFTPKDMVDFLAQLSDQAYNNDTSGTLVYAIRSPKGQLQYCLAGHPAPLFFDSFGRQRKIKSTTCPAIGYCDKKDFKRLAYEENFGVNQIVLQPKDWAIFYTDGLPDLIDTNGMEYGIKRFRKFLSGNITPKTTPQELSARLVGELWRFSPTYQRNDDITFVTIKRKS